ncbi:MULTISPECIES: MucBP domain-containing protein [unclassified Enterococcus]|nr:MULTISPECIES: MucBP domain-containing protein [unclassified Enterococcus]
MVTVRYVDQDGKEVKAPKGLIGTIGETFNAVDEQIIFATFLT